MIAEDEESRVRHDLLVSALDSLNDREKHILMERRLADEPKTLEELSQVYGVSRERIRQIEVRAFEKLQAALLRLAGERRLLRPPRRVGTPVRANRQKLGIAPVDPLEHAGARPLVDQPVRRNPASRGEPFRNHHVVELAELVLKRLERRVERLGVVLGARIDRAQEFERVAELLRAQAELVPLLFPHLGQGPLARQPCPILLQSARGEAAER